MHVHLQDYLRAYYYAPVHMHMRAVDSDGAEKKSRDLRKITVIFQKIDGAWNNPYLAEGIFWYAIGIF